MVKKVLPENKSKGRPTRTPHVAFVVASPYRLQNIFLLSQACLSGIFPFFVRDDQRFGRNNASKQGGTRKTSWSPSGVNFASRQSALTHTLKPKGQERLLRLVTMYHPAVKIRKQILMEHWSLLHSQPLLKTISTNLWSSLTKKGKSLEDMLVRAKKKNK